MLTIGGATPIGVLDASTGTTNPRTERQFGFDSHAPEVTNVRLARSPDVPLAGTPTSGMKLATVATEDFPSIIRPDSLPKKRATEGMFDLGSTLPMGPQRKPLIVASVDGDSSSLASATFNSQGLPADPLFSTVLPETTRHSNPARVASLTTEKAISGDRALLDQSPFGIACDISAKSKPTREAMIALSVNAPCRPNARLRVTHDRLVFSIKTNHIGRLNFLVPALSAKAKISLIFDDGTTIRVQTTVPDLGRFERVAISWSGDFDLDLHALEFRDAPGSPTDVWVGRNGPPLPTGVPRSNVISMGDPTLHPPELAEVYTLTVTGKPANSLVKMSVLANKDSATCGQMAGLYSLRSSGGKTVSANGYRFALPGCALSSNSVILQSAVRDLKISAN